MVAALSFDYFARQQVDVAVIETGLGGRLDATNVLQPELTIITDISVDHSEILGETLEEIAGEKAGIIKNGVPNLTGLLPKAAADVMREVCKTREAPLHRLTRKDFRIDRSGLCLDFDVDGLSLKSFAPSLHGTHQLRNCALVLKALTILRESGFMVSKAAITQGLKLTEWPGRFQVLPPNGDRPKVILDVCHNEAGAAAFADTFKRKYPGQKARIMIGLVKRKPHQQIIDVLTPIAHEFHLVPLPTKRTTDTKELEAGLNWNGIPLVRSSRLETGWRKLLKRTTPDDIICILGSHYLVGDYLKKYVWK